MGVKRQSWEDTKAHRQFWNTSGKQGNLQHSLCPGRSIRVDKVKGEAVAGVLNLGYRLDQPCCTSSVRCGQARCGFCEP